MSDLVGPLLSVTDAARATILEVRAGETDADSLALYVEVTGESTGAYSYDLSFRRLDEIATGDVVQRHDELSVVIAEDSVDRLAGAVLDFNGSGMVMENPNKPAPPGQWGDRPPAELSGEIPQAIIRILEAEINPAIAAHGGRADLVAVEDGVAYLRLSGGCQGCGMASVTLGQGIEVAILDAVPEISRVVDVTDHASGDNPYYEAAKK
jgi:Fe/S biogenesis protein NfuA